MKVNLVNKHVEVILSRRNLEDLLHALEHKEKHPSSTLIKRDNGFLLTVTSQENEDHYKDRQPGPGMRWCSEGR